MFNRYVIVGAGGIGGFLLEPLARFLIHEFEKTNSPLKTSSDKGAEIFVVDGDSYELRNKDRQSFAIKEMGNNKAVVQVEALSGKLEGPISVNAVDEYLTARNTESIICENSVVFGCVDSNTVRKLMQDRCNKLRNVFYICGGNGTVEFNISLYRRKDNIEKRPPITHDRPELKFPKDKNPADMGCGEIADTSPQIIFANMLCAGFMLGAFYSELFDKPWERSEILCSYAKPIIVQTLKSEYKGLK